MVLKAGAARAVINPPLTLAHGGWGAQAHITPDCISDDFWSTVLVLSDGDTTAVIVDLDFSSLSNTRADHLRSAVANALQIGKHHVRVSTTHTHAGPVIGDGAGSAENSIAETYFRYLVEQTVGAAMEASRRLAAVTVQAEYGVSHVGKNRRQLLPDGNVITGFEPLGDADPTVTVVRFDDENGASVANIVHYACHPTTLGYTNRAASPDYPGVVKRFVEQTIGGTCLFLQGAAGDIGPGPGGFLDRMDVVRDIGVSLGCAAAQALIEAKSKRYSYSFSRVVESGASLGIWEREIAPAQTGNLQVVSALAVLPLKSLEPPHILMQKRDELQQKLNRLRVESAADEQIRLHSFQLKRANMALRLSSQFYGQSAAEIEVHAIRIGDIAFVSVPLEPFSADGKRIRERSPFRYTLFSGYSNGVNGYLPSADEYAKGGYEAEFSAFAADAADELVRQVVAILNRMGAVC